MRLVANIQCGRARKAGCQKMFPRLFSDHSSPPVFLGRRYSITVRGRRFDSKVGIYSNSDTLKQATKHEAPTVT